MRLESTCRKKTYNLRTSLRRAVYTGLQGAVSNPHYHFLFELKLSPEEVWNSNSVKACLLTHAIRLRPKNEKGNFLNILSK